MCLGLVSRGVIQLKRGKISQKGGYCVGQGKIQVASSSSRGSSDIIKYLFSQEQLYKSLKSYKPQKLDQCDDRLFKTPSDILNCFAQPYFDGYIASSSYIHVDGIAENVLLCLKKAKPKMTTVLIAFLRFFYLIVHLLFYRTF